VDVAEHVQTMLHYWRRILLLTVLFALGVLVYNARQPKRYAATAHLMVTSGRESISEADTTDTNFIVQTYVALGESVPVVADAWKRSGLTIDYGTAARRLSVDQEPGTAFLKVKATGPSSADALALARGESQALAEAVRVGQYQTRFADAVALELTVEQFQKELNAIPPNDPRVAGLRVDIQKAVQAQFIGQTRPTNHIDFTWPATSSSSPIAPRPFHDALIAFLIGLVIIAEGSVVLRVVSDRFSATDDSEDILKVAGFPVLARIPTGSDAQTLEAFRILRTNLMFLEGAGKPRTIAIVSSNPDAGKTFVAVHLAESAAALDEKVVLIDADLRKPAVHERLGVARAPGLSAVLQGADVNSALRRNESSPFLRVLPSGAPVGDPSGLLGARGFRQVLDELRAVRLVVVDTPPGEPYADAIAVASQCDATIFVLDMTTSRKRSVRATVESLERGGANIIGIVVNRATVSRRAAYYGT
jgi:capsular exopolysaccharide synthesis family protein